MNKKHSIVLLFLVWGISGFTQNVLISEGHFIRDGDAHQLIGKIDKTILLFADKADSYEISAYNEDMEEQWEKKIELDSKRAKILDILETRHDFTIIYRYTKRGKIYTQAVKMNSDAEVLKTDTIEVQNSRSFFTSSKVVESEDGQYVLIYETEINSRIYARVFDLKNMTTIWNKVFLLDDMDLERDFVQPLVDNTGQAYFIFGKDNRKARREENRFVVLTYNDETAIAENYKFSMKDQVWFDVKFDYDNLNKRLLAAGLYSDKRYSETNGYFYMNASLDAPEEYLLHFVPFDQKLIVRTMGKSGDKINGINEVSVQNLVLRRDGGLLMIVERNRFHTRRAASYTAAYGSSRSENNHIDYHYDDILLFSIHPDGALHWTETLQKRQFSQDDNARFSSYFLMHSRRNLRFLYNDEIRADTSVNEYTVSGKGKQERNSIYHTKKENLMLLLPDAVQVAANELIVPSERRSTLKLVRIVY